MTQRPALSALAQATQQSAERGQQRCACGAKTQEAECDSCASKRRLLQRKPTHGAGSAARVPPALDDVLRLPGRPLDVGTRSFMEDRFGRDFSQVRVHTDVPAAHSALALGAAAYTSGNDIVFAPGRYAPGSDHGHRLLAHELTHVVQQSRWHAPSSRLLGDPADAAEHEADATAERVLRGEPANIREAPTALIHGDLSDGEKWGVGLGIAGGAIGLGLGIAWLAGAFDRKKQKPGQDNVDCEKLAGTVRTHAAYLDLDETGRGLADQIIRKALDGRDCLRFLAKLAELLDTPKGPEGDTEAYNRGRVEQAAAKERKRLETPEGKRDVGAQEDLANDPSRHWTQRVGRDGKTYLVDASDPRSIVVRVRVRLVAAGATTTETDIANMVALEDEIERIAQTRGYTVDVEFAAADGPDVFTVGADMAKPATVKNIVGNAKTLAHEFHHLLNLRDRYDYIAIHAKNPNFSVKQRLGYFLAHMDREQDIEGDKSLMGRGNKLLEEDICAVAGLDKDACVRERATAP